MNTQLARFLASGMLLLPLLLWLYQTGSPLIYFTDDAPAGQLPYVLSKLFALYALAFIHFQIMAVLLAKLGNRFPRSMHFVLGVMILILSLSHFLLFVSAASLRQGGMAWSLFAFDFDDFYHTYLSVGLISLLTLVLVVFLGALQSRFRGPVFRIAHRLYFLVIGGVYLHSLSVGSEMQSFWGVLYFSTLGFIVVILTMLVFIKGRREVAGYASL